MFKTVGCIMHDVSCKLYLEIRFRRRLHRSEHTNRDRAAHTATCTCYSLISLYAGESAAFRCIHESTTQSRLSRLNWNSRTNNFFTKNVARKNVIYHSSSRCRCEKSISFARSLVCSPQTVALGYRSIIVLISEHRSSGGEWARARAHSPACSCIS